MTPTQQLIREIESEFDEKFDWYQIADLLNTDQSMKKLKFFFLAKLSQVLESVEREIEREAIDGMNLDEYDQGINRGVRAALLVLKEARDAANKTTI